MAVPRCAVIMGYRGMFRPRLIHVRSGPVAGARLEICHAYGRSFGAIPRAVV